MRVIERTIEYCSTNDIITITPIGDTHFGNAATDERLIKRVVQQVADDPLHFWIGGGDYVEAINRKDRRYRETSVASWLHSVNDVVKRQIEKARDELEPIKDKCLGMVYGNHEDDNLKWHERNVYAYLVDYLKPEHNVPIMLGIQGFIRLRLTCVTSTGVRHNTWTVNIYAHHGEGGGILEGADALALGRVMRVYDCDVVLLWHRHRRHYIDQKQVTPAKRGNKVRDRYRVAMFCGAFLRSYSEDEVYVERKPTVVHKPLGPLQIQLRPGDKKIDIRIPQW